MWDGFFMLLALSTIMGIAYVSSDSIPGVSLLSNR
jgi:hypothetical protein